MQAPPRLLCWLLLCGLLMPACGRRSPVATPPLPDIRTITWGEESALPGQTRTLVAEVTGEITSYAWTIDSELATLVSTAGSQATVALHRAGNLEVGLAVTGPAGADQRTAAFEITAPVPVTFRHLVDVPFIEGQTRGLSAGVHAVAGDSLWLITKAELGLGDSPRKLTLSKVPLISIEDPTTWEIRLFEEANFLNAFDAIMAINGETLYVIYVTHESFQRPLYLASAQIRPQLEDMVFQKVLLPAEIPRFKIAENTCTYKDGIYFWDFDDAISRYRLGRLPLSPETTGTDYLEGVLPRSIPYRTLNAPQMLATDAGLVFADTSTDLFFLIKNEAPPWEVYSRWFSEYQPGEDVYISPYAFTENTGVTGLGVWGEKGVVLGFRDDFTARNYFMTSTSRAPKAGDWSTPVELPLLIYGNPVLWGGRQVWQTGFSPPSNERGLVRAVAAPPTRPEDYVYAPLTLDFSTPERFNSYYTTSMQNLVEVEGRLIMIGTFYPEGDFAGAPTIVRLVQSDGPW